MTYCSRALSAEDLVAIAPIEARVHLHPWTHPQIASMAAQWDGLYVGQALCHSAELVGYVFAQRVLDELEILSVGIDTPHQGQGQSPMLLQSFIRRMHAWHGVIRVHLEVRPSNPAAIRCYRACGLLEVGRRVGYYPPTVTQPREDALLMALDLNTP